jgi:hypothetical protein
VSSISSERRDMSSVIATGRGSLARQIISNEFTSIWQCPFGGMDTYTRIVSGADRTLSTQSL